ncbi:MBL fold metallo-hydrolase [Clostridium paraputrificum]|uniref:MBL fold metallo-hydrolase n=1 Tax=Clostridium TaxID=1485 RepID=UPI003D33E83F
MCLKLFNKVNVNSYPADIILITHEHEDHNKLDLVTKKDNTKIIRSRDALKDGAYYTFDEQGIKIESVPAYNKNHKKDLCVGYIIEVDGIKIYHAGDTS